MMNSTPYNQDDVVLSPATRSRSCEPPRGLSPVRATASLFERNSLNASPLYTPPRNSPVRNFTNSLPAGGVSEKTLRRTWKISSPRVRSSEDGSTGGTTTTRSASLPSTLLAATTTKNIDEPTTKTSDMYGYDKFNKVRDDDKINCYRYQENTPTQKMKLRTSFPFAIDLQGEDETESSSFSSSAGFEELRLEKPSSTQQSSSFSSESSEEPSSKLEETAIADAEELLFTVEKEGNSFDAELYMNKLVENLKKRNENDETAAGFDAELYMNTLLKNLKERSSENDVSCDVSKVVAVLLSNSQFVDLSAATNEPTNELESPAETSRPAPRNDYSKRASFDPDMYLNCLLEKVKVSHSAQQ